MLCILCLCTISGLGLIFKKTGIFFTKHFCVFSSYLYTPFPGRYRLRASHPDYEIELRGSPEVRFMHAFHWMGCCHNHLIVLHSTFYYIQVDLRFGNVLADDVFFVSGYNIYGSVVAQV